MESSDQRFDKLIEESVVRSKHLEAMNIRIMASVKRSARRRRVKMWCRMVTFALFVPLSIGAFVVATYAAYDFFGGVRGVAVAGMIAITGVVSELRLMADFSPYEV